MPRVRAHVLVAARAAVAEELWYDTSRWPAFVDGLAAVAKVEGDWPRAGRVVWNAPHGGRGRVVERVLRYEARVGQTVSVEDERLFGERDVTFTPQDDACRVALELRYELKQRPPLPFVVELVSRRPEQDRLRRTLTRFRRELEAVPF